MGGQDIVVECVLIGCEIERAVAQVVLDAYGQFQAVACHTAQLRLKV